MGKAYYRKSEYDEAITRLEQLQKDHPESDLLAEAQMYLAKTHVAKDDPDKAVPILQAVFERNPKSKLTDEVLFLLGTNLVRINEEEKALRYLEILAETYPNSTFRVDADLEIADLYLERGDYEKSLAVFRKLSGVKLSDDNLIRFLTKLAEAQVKIGRYPAALRTFTRLERFVVRDTEQASQMLYKGQALVGLDSVAAGIEVFESVLITYPRSMFSAEAAYRLGATYQEKLDSLEVAKAKFDQVPRQYSKSPYAPEAIRRSVSITKLQKLRESLGTEEGEDKASVQFDMSEVQLFQFSDYEKALEGYKVILDQYPNSEVAPKAAYAVAYIYETLLKEPAKARAAYLVVVQRYPESQQAVYARRYLGLEIEQDKPAAPDSLDSASKGEEP
jgi:TolA-binding protein